MALINIVNLYDVTNFVCSRLDGAVEEGYFICDGNCDKSIGISAILGETDEVKRAISQVKHDQWCYLDCERLIFADDTDNVFLLKQYAIEYGNRALKEMTSN
jgi:hypothetical protein